MEIVVTVAIDAPTAVVWRELVDVERWPQWTATMTSVKRLEEGPLAIGSSARIKQPMMRAMVWRVNAFVEQQSFTWAASSPGLTLAADHELAVDGNTTIVTLRARFSGPLGGLLGWMSSSRSRRFVQMEADGLKRVCESAAT